MRKVLIASFGLLLAAAPPPRADDFRPLFDGKSLDGWRLVNTEGNFIVRDGRLVLDKGMGWLATEKTFADFEFRVRYRFVTPGADSGVFIRASIEGDNWTGRGYQVQNMDDPSIGKIYGMGIDNPKGSHDPEAAARARKPSGEWNELTVVAQGKSARVTLNGVQVETTDELEIDAGHIGLQAEGGILEFDAITLKPLTR